LRRCSHGGFSVSDLHPILAGTRVIDAVLRVTVRVVRVLLTPRALDRVRVFLWVLPFRVLRSASVQCQARAKLRDRVKVHTEFRKILLTVRWTVVTKQFSLFVPFPGLCLSCNQRTAGDGKFEGRRFVVATPPWSCVVGVGIRAVLWEVLLAVIWIVVTKEFSLVVFFLSCDERGDRERSKGKGEGGAGEQSHQAQEDTEGRVHDGVWIRYTRITGERIEKRERAGTYATTEREEARGSGSREHSYEVYKLSLV
jgi:hypothetical protein